MTDIGSAVPATTVLVDGSVFCDLHTDVHEDQSAPLTEGIDSGREHWRSLWMSPVEPTGWRAGTAKISPNEKDVLRTLADYQTSGLSARGLAGETGLREHRVRWAVQAPRQPRPFEPGTWVDKKSGARGTQWRLTPAGVDVQWMLGGLDPHDEQGAHDDENGPIMETNE